MKAKFLILALFILLWGCASRKTDTSISKTVDQTTNDKKESGEVRQNEESRTTETNVAKKDKEKTETTTTTNEKFNPDGSVKERTTTTSNKKATDKSTATYTRVRTKIKTLLVKYNIVQKQTVYRTTYQKHKETSANNIAWYFFGAAVVVIILRHFKVF